MGIGNQDENQDDFQDEKNLKNLDENISCNIFLEQFNLINELPEKDRANVLYLALLNAFYEKSRNQDENQLENQDENTYISISISISNSIYKSLSNISKSVLNLLYKTVVCKNYNKKWGGKRDNSGRKKQISEPQIKVNEIPTRDEILEFVNSLCKKIDVDNFIAYYSASNWKDKDGMPFNWKQKVISWANRYKEPEKSTIEEQTEIINKLREQAKKEGRI